VLLNIFHLYGPAEQGEYVDVDGFLNIRWDRQCWWYKLTHVCRQWRHFILESPSRLDLHLVCTKGVPVADMLAHSPPLPLTIYYRTVGQNREITAEDESGILLALSLRDRVHHIHLSMLRNVGKFVTVMDDQFPSLEHMYIRTRTEEVVLPVTFQAPNLRHLRLWRASLLIGSPLLTTTACLVNLMLSIPASAYLPPSYLLTCLSLMTQLETLSIDLYFPLPNRDLGQLHQTPDMTALPNLRIFVLHGTARYLEGLVSRISAPSLSILRVYLFNQLSFTFPHLLQFVQTSENLTLSAVQLTFTAHSVFLHAVPWKWDSHLKLEIVCRHLDWQVASAVRLSDTLSPVLSVVEQVAFSYEEHNQSSEWHNDVDRRQWRELLRPFANAKTIHVQDGLVSQIFRSLPSDDGEPPLELLPNLEEVGYSGESHARDAFTTFLNERQVAGHPVSLRLVDPSIFKNWILIRKKDGPLYNYVL
jgi:hypothetical protein